MTRARPTVKSVAMALPVFVLRFLIRAYQLLVSPILAGTCRYHPTCSQYSLEAVESHGPIRGTWLALKRICRCHPWGSSGFDPVPPLKTDSATEKTEPIAGKCIAPEHGHGYIRASNSHCDSTDISPGQSS